MDNIESIEVDDTELDTLLGTGGTGVLSFAAEEDESPYAVPVSYGYDATERNFYFRLATDDDSPERSLGKKAVTFVTYNQDEGVWWSVVAQGVLEPVDERTGDTDILAGLESVDIPYVDIFGQPLHEVGFDFYRLVPVELSGRKEQQRL